MKRYQLTDAERLALSMAGASIAAAAQQHPGYLSMVLNIMSALSSGRPDRAEEYIRDYAERAS